MASIGISKYIYIYIIYAYRDKVVFLLCQLSYSLLSLFNKKKIVQDWEGSKTCPLRNKW